MHPTLDRRDTVCVVRQPILDTVTDGLTAFLPLSRDLLAREAGTLLPTAPTVLELTDDIVIDADVLESCRRLHGLDYRLASDMSTPARCRAVAAVIARRSAASGISRPTRPTKRCSIQRCCR